MNNNQDDIIGTRIGIYDVLYKNEVKEKGYSTYHVKCSECGWESDMRKTDIKRAKSCTHINKLNQKQIDDWYEQNKKKCLNCGKYIPLKVESFFKYKVKKFCDSSCAATYNNKIRKLNSTKSKRKNLYCLNCDKELPKSAKKFCSPKCQKNYYYKQYISRWKAREEDGLSGEYQLSGYIERYIKEKYNFQCARCGWHEINPVTGKSPLEIEHIDGDYTNNKEENLILLCPNCHSLTPTYKALNKGRGRKERNKYNLPHTINYKNKENN